MSQFLTHTAVSPQGDSRWQAEVHRGWRIGSVANGGYVLALVGRTLSEALNQPDPLSINAFYLAPVALGEVEVAVESLSETRSTHFASADLRQEGELKLRATAAYTDLDKLKGPDWTNVTPPDVGVYGVLSDFTVRKARQHEDDLDKHDVHVQENLSGQLWDLDRLYPAATRGCSVSGKRLHRGTTGLRGGGSGRVEQVAPKHP